MASLACERVSKPVDKQSSSERTVGVKIQELLEARISIKSQPDVPCIFIIITLKRRYASVYNDSRVPQCALGEPDSMNKQEII